MASDIWKKTIDTERKPLYEILFLISRKGTFFMDHSTDIENTTRVPVGDDLSYNEWFLKRILRAKAS